MRLVFDTETDGLLPELTKLHCLTIQDPDTGQEWSCADQPEYLSIEEGLALLSAADELIGHNIIDFDLPAIRKVYGWEPKAGTVLTDTLVFSRMAYPSLYDIDDALIKAGKMEAKYMKRYSLMAWGQRLGVCKEDYSGGWGEWSKEMQGYGEQDTRVTTALLKKLEGKVPNYRAPLDTEQAIDRILKRQEKDGVPFDMLAAGALHGDLAQRRMDLETQLIETFGSWEVKTYTTNKRAMHRKIPGTWVVEPRHSEKTGKRLKDYEGPELEFIAAGQRITHTTEVTFNPGSRDHIAKVLKERFGWEPEQLTKGGKPVVDEEMLGGLAHIPQAALLIDYLTVTKREGALANGNGAWMTLAKLHSDGAYRIHGRVNHMGTPHSRCSHDRPNLTAVPKVGSTYGKECRSLFTAAPGMVLVGADASGCQLRMLAHYLGRWDEGAYRDLLLTGDPHQRTADILGITRNDAKTFTYAHLFGAYDPKLGGIIDEYASKKEKGRLGAKARSDYEQGVVGLDHLVAGLDDKLKSSARYLNGKYVGGSRHINGLDGRPVPVKSENTALNYLLSSAEAIVMKWSVIRWHELMQEHGYTSGTDYVQHLFNHDEIQASARPEIAEITGSLFVLSIKQAGLHFNLRCPLDGEYKIGRTWSDTH